MIEASPLTQLSAMTSLSHMKLTEADATNALDSFLNVSKTSGDDLTLANVLNAAFHLVQNANGVGGERLLQIVENVCRKPGPQVNYSTARALWLHTPLITNELLTAMAGTLQLVDPTHKVTLGEIDSGLRHLLDTALADKGIELLRLILIRNPDTVTIAEFDSFGHKLLGKHDGTFERVIVAWLLSGEKSLCQALDQLLAKAPGDDRSITLTAEQLSELRQTEKLFLCRKAIGYFFLHPVFAASIIASILRVCSEEDAGVFRDLLVDPLLRNYGGELRDYLSKVKEDDLAYRATQIALSEADRYLTDVRSVGEVDELKPTERERQAAHRKDADEVRRTHKAAMAQSVLLSMVRRSVVLYGKRTVTYVANPDGNRRPIEMDLKPHSFGWEIPRTSVIDPVGLDYMLRVFRNERIR
jgi:hypothetical protein